MINAIKDNILTNIVKIKYEFIKFYKIFYNLKLKNLKIININLIVLRY